MAVVADGHAAMAAARPAVQLLGHDVAVGAGHRVVGHVGIAAGVDEREAAQPDAGADRHRRGPCEPRPRGAPRVSARAVPSSGNLCRRRAARSARTLDHDRTLGNVSYPTRAVRRGFFPALGGHRPACGGVRRRCAGPTATVVPPLTLLHVVEPLLVQAAAMTVDADVIQDECRQALAALASSVTSTALAAAARRSTSGSGCRTSRSSRPPPTRTPA